MSINKKLYQNLPAKPGVYLFKDETGVILYVGKAKNLKKRVSSYFAKTHTDRPWTTVMVELIKSVETIVVTNETEALMLESTLIKQHLPRFNIQLTDDKSYPFIKLVENEAVPRFTIVRQRERTVLQKKGEKARYFGPYLSGWAAKSALEFLRSLYGVHLSPTPLKHKDRPCLNCQLDGFTCPLNDEISPEKYQERINSAIAFLQGKRKDLVNNLEVRMEAAAGNEQFELAGKLRDRLKGLRQTFSRQQVISSNDDDYDAIGVFQTSSRAAVSLLRVREGRVVGQDSCFFSILEQKESDVIREFLLSLYATNNELPELVVIPVVIEDQAEIATLLGENAGHVVELRVPERGDKYQIVELAVKNAEAKLADKLLKSGQAQGAVVALKELLKLDFFPTRIEAVDISNLGTSEPVGATVCFSNGLPDKNEYRRYKIKTVSGQNDFAMIAEVTKRRFSDTSRNTPDLFVVDGGPEQLRSALKGLMDAPMEPRAIISLAKKPDRIFRPDFKRPLPTKRGDKGLLLLARIRDEVHRFGIGFQRTRQRKKSLAVED
ncbi:MAG TPA: excinuclease ABC subunit UvrC [Candidatus Saccharimonadales bacterium]|nr:excinuclease ABC subunit UvrC [Candidatus Saccharimonadales bacterium]